MKEIAGVNSGPGKVVPDRIDQNVVPLTCN
jgi:hypothetical protein